jgi:hypothetical protein
MLDKSQGQIYPRKLSKNCLGYTISFENEEFRLDTVSEGGIYIWRIKDCFGRIPYSYNCVWYIPFTSKLEIDMDIWDKFILSAFSDPFLPHGDLISLLSKNFTWYLPEIEFTNVR